MANILRWLIVGKKDGKGELEIDEKRDRWSNPGATDARTAQNRSDGLEDGLKQDPHLVTITAITQVMRSSLTQLYR